MQTLYQIVKYDFRTSKASVVHVCSDFRNADEEALMLAVDYVRNQDGSDKVSDVSRVIVNTKTKNRVKYSELLYDRPDGHYIMQGGDGNHNKLTVITRRSKTNWWSTETTCEKVFELQIVELPYASFSAAFKICKRLVSEEVSEPVYFLPQVDHVLSSLRKISESGASPSVTQLKAEHPEDFQVIVPKSNYRSAEPSPGLSASILEVVSYEL